LVEGVFLGEEPWGLCLKDETMFAELTELVREIHALVDSHSQADPKFKTPLAYTRMTAKAVREQLMANTATKDQHVPAERSL